MVLISHLLSYFIDTCAVGGRLYNVGDQFICVDNANNCKCLQNNRFSSTRKNASVKEMCFDDIREIKDQ